MSNQTVQVSPTAAERARPAELEAIIATSAAITWAVALALTGAAAVVRAAAGGTRSRALRAAGWGVVAVFTVRGLVYPPLDVIGGLDDTYDRLDLAIYSPLCLALALATALVLRRTAPGHSQRLPAAVSSVGD